MKVTSIIDPLTSHVYVCVTGAPTSQKTLLLHYKDQQLSVSRYGRIGAEHNAMDFRLILPH